MRVVRTCAIFLHLVLKIIIPNLFLIFIGTVFASDTNFLSTSLSGRLTFDCNIRKTLKIRAFYPLIEEKVCIALLSGSEKLGSRVNFLDVLKYPEYENRTSRVSYIYVQIL